jgi:hypothetical protein
MTFLWNEYLNYGCYFSYKELLGDKHEGDFYEGD